MWAKNGLILEVTNKDIHLITSVNINLLDTKYVQLRNEKGQSFFATTIKFIGIFSLSCYTNFTLVLIYN